MTSENAIKIEVRLFAGLRKNRFKTCLTDFPSGTCLRNILDHLKIDRQEVSICLVNGRFSELERILSSGDVVAIFPAIGGG